MIDELPLLAVAMAGAEGTSTVRDAEELRVKESDRIALVVGNLVAIGVAATELPDGWRIEGSGARHGTGATARTPVKIVTAGDHRIAISFCVAALTGIAGEIVIDDPDCVDVSYPGFWNDVEVLTTAVRAPAPILQVAPVP